MNYASFWRRIFAGLIDGLMYMPIELIRIKYAPDYWVVILLDHILFGIYCVFFWMRYTATPGMMLMRIHIIVKEGKRLTLCRAIVRYIGIQISAITIIGGLWMLWDKHRQMWHDKLAGTYVVKKEKVSEQGQMQANSEQA